jgi:hypothetical protein
MATEQDRVSGILQQQLQTALLRRKRASLAFDGACSARPGLPHSDGAQQIQNTSKELSAALEALTVAVKRRTDYLLTKIAPDDLKS